MKCRTRGAVDWTGSAYRKMLPSARTIVSHLPMAGPSKFRLVSLHGVGLFILLSIERASQLGGSKLAQVTPTDLMDVDLY